jgi:hypothetical protein
MMRALLKTNCVVRFALAALICGGAAVLEAGTMVPTYQPAGIQSANASALCLPTTACFVGEETFTLWDGTKPFATSFSTTLDNVGILTGGIQGNYTGGLTRSAANQYGGADGSGYYPTVSNSSYTLTLTTSGDVPGVNYFGLWFSALDNGNELQFYEDSTLLYTFTPALFRTLVGACPGSAFCGNPTTTFSRQDPNEQFAFLNFFYVGGGYFNKVVFTQTNTAGFESDNHTVAYLNPPVPSGTLIEAAPEPGSIALVALGAAVVIGLKRRSMRGC